MSKSYIILVILSSLTVVATAMSLQRCTRTEPEGARDNANTPSMAPPIHIASNPTSSETQGMVANMASERAQVARPAPAVAQYGHIKGLRLRLNQPISAESEVVRGLTVDDDAVYLATTVPDGGMATLYRLRRDILTVLQERDLSQGAHDLIGGLHLSGDILWVPVADGAYSAPGRGTSRILALDPQSLETRQGFVVGDQIALVVQAPSGRLIGFNDEGTQAYEWTVNGQEVRRRPLTTGAVYRDAEVVGENMVCAGVDENGGVLDVLDPDSLTLLARHRCVGTSQLDSHLTEYGFGVSPRIGSDINEGQEPLFYFAVPGVRMPMLLSFVIEDMPVEQWLPIGQSPRSQ